jgi:hypothetical protein
LERQALSFKLEWWWPKWLSVDTLGDLDRFAMLQSKRVFKNLFLLFLVPFGIGQALAQPADLYTVSNIPVDATADNAVAARAEAHRQGQQDGFNRLMRRLVPATEHGRLPNVADLTVDRYVSNFEIAGEQLSATRYLAKMTVAFDPRRIQELLEAERLPFSEEVSDPLVVLPLYEGPSGPALWPDGNPWWAAWATKLESERPLRLVLPLGDLEDVSAMTIEQARAGDTLSLQRLAARYGAKNGIVVIAEPLSDPASGGPISVRLNAQRVGEASRQGQPFTLEGAPGESLEQVFETAVVRLQDSLDEQWKSSHILRLDTGGLIFVDIPIGSLADWVTINQGLEGLAEVSQVEIASFARNLVQAQIYYVGDEIGFDRALDRLGLRLSREEESWLLLPTAADPRLDALPTGTQNSS